MILHPNRLAKGGEYLEKLFAAETKQVHEGLGRAQKSAVQKEWVAIFDGHLHSWACRGKGLMGRKMRENLILKVPHAEHPCEVYKEGEEKYRRVFEGSKDMVYMTSADGKHTEVNQAGVDLLGYGSKEEMLQVYARDVFLYTEDQKRFMNEVIKEGFVKDFEAKLKRKDGKPIDVLITANARRDAMGKIISYDGIIKDISDRKRMEEELVQRTRELEALSEMGTLINQSLNLDTVFRTALEKVLSVTGFDMGSLYLLNEIGDTLERISYIGLPPSLVEDGKFLKYGEGVSGNAIRLKQPVITYVNQYSSLQGVPALLEEGIQTMMGFPLQTKGKVVGTITLFSHFHRNLSQGGTSLLENIGTQIGMAIENAKLFSQLAKAKSEWEATFDAVTEGIIIVDRDYRILRANKDAHEQMGLEPGDLIGKRCFEAFEGRDKPCEGCSVSDVFKMKKKAFLDRENPYTKRIFQSKAFPIFDEEKEVVGAVELVHDITEEKKSEMGKEVINHINKIIASSLDVKQVIQAAYADLKRILDFERMSIVLFDDEGERFRFFALEKDYNASALVGNVLYPTKGTNIKRVAETGEPALISDFVESDAWVEKKLLEEEGIRSSLIFPLEYKGKIIGTMNFGSRKRDHFSEDHFSLLRQIAPGLAISIQNALLLETTNKLAQENAIMAEIGRIIGSTLNINDVYERFAEKVHELIPFERITIHILNLIENTIQAAYVTGLKVTDHSKGGVTPLTGGIAEEVIRTRRTMFIQIEDLKKVKDRFPELLPNFQAGIRSLMAIPLISKDKVIGILHLQSTNPDAYSENYLRLAERVGNQIAGAIANAQLFYERKEAEEELRKNKETLQAIMDSSPVAVSWANMEGNIEYTNRKFHELFGYTISDIPTVSQWRRLAYPDPAQRKRLDTWRDEVIEAQKFGRWVPPVEVTVTCKDGSTREMTVVGTLASNRILVIYNDITERKRAEEALKRNQEELLEKNKEIEANRKNLQLALEELERAYKELKASQAKILQQEKMASIGQLSSGVAHEINNPMAFISSNLRTLDKYIHRLTEFIQTQSEVIESLKETEAVEGLKKKQKELKLDYIVEDIKELVKESLDGSDRVRKIVQGLKTFARVDEADYKSADINECIETTINIVWNELKYKAILKRDFGDLPLTKCFPQQLNQVFMNILVNAAHAIEKQGEITIKTWHEEGFIFIAISDTGCGIREENLNRIFEPFFTTKEVGEGTGLGLSIAYEIVKKHQGEITVKSEVGKGTKFTVKIPIVVEG